MTTITISESKRLIALEKIVEKGKQTFIEVGAALAEIRDSKLYRVEFSTFEDYCQNRWGWKRAYAYQLIDGAEAVKSLPPEMSTMVDNQRQAREIAAIEPSRRAEVIEKAAEVAQSESRPITARDIREAAKPAPEPEAVPEPTPEPAPAAPTQDGKWLSAIGQTNARNFFAGQIEDVVSDALNSASEEQLGYLVLELETSVRKVRKMINERKLQAA